MKRRIPNIFGLVKCHQWKYVLLVLEVFLPLYTILFSLLGYQFELFNYSFFAIVTMIISIVNLVTFVRQKEHINKKASAFIAALLIPLSLISLVFYILKSSFDGVDSWFSGISMFISVVCCFYYSVLHTNSRLGKWIEGILVFLFLIPIALLVLFMLAVGSMGRITVVETVESPNGTYYAEVVDFNEGALGGETCVRVYEKKGFDVFIFQVKKRPQNIYEGPWGEFKNMDIYWKDERCLVINTEEYSVE